MIDVFSMEQCQEEFPLPIKPEALALLNLMYNVTLARPVVCIAFYEPDWIIA
jgi:hypothetical protein